MRGLFVRADIRDAPKRGGAQQSVNGQSIAVLAIISQSCIKIVFFPISPEAVVVQAIGPRSQERDSGLHRLFLKIGQLPIGKVQNILPVNLHFGSDISDRRQDGNLDPARGVGETNHGNAVDRNLLRRERRSRIFRHEAILSTAKR